MSAINRHIGLLGYRAKDKITGLKGVVDCISFDLYGCIQAGLRPKANADGTVPEAVWVDVRRLHVLPLPNVLAPPDYDEGYQAEGRQGAAAKPPRA